MAANPLERNWQAHGLDCAVIRIAGMGHRCGYVRVPDDHPWHGVQYNDPAPGIPPSDEVLSERVIGDDMNIIGALLLGCSDDEQRAERARTPGFWVAVHGGITYSGTLDGEDDLPRGWWFGFDCAHLDDSPAQWTEDRVARETERMAEQIAAVQVAS